ncbi:Hypothetical predicted protein [Podarcis lilfordi]|uniref:Uncharacterized protein n=2 Tax=Podarcis lilfordi TaxID=74358 RepID=A0AA35JP37_9SAUR|nr:Hypothetical predicted protein [Podarcis lilfordi]
MGDNYTGGLTTHEIKAVPVSEDLKRSRFYNNSSEAGNPEMTLKPKRFDFSAFRKKLLDTKMSGILKLHMQKSKLEN